MFQEYIFSFPDSGLFAKMSVKNWIGKTKLHIKIFRKVRCELTFREMKTSKLERYIIELHISYI